MGSSRDKATIDWTGFEGNEAIFPVCMRSPSVLGSSLTSQLKAASERVERIVILMCDSLDRHNYTKLENAKEKCIEQSEIWLEANIGKFKEKFKTVDVLKWEKDIVNHPDFNKRMQDVLNLGGVSNNYSGMRDSMTMYYLVSQRKRYEDTYKRGLEINFDPLTALKSSKKYLEEEFAGNIVYHEMTGLNAIYSGLYVDDVEIFSRESGDKTMIFPKTIPVTSKRHGRSIGASELAIPSNKELELLATA